MNRNFQHINNALTEQLFQQSKYHFQLQQNPGAPKNPSMNPIPLSLLPLLLQKLKISIPESMMKDYLKCMSQHTPPMMSFKQFTHYVARASLQSQIEDQLKNLFSLIDREETGTINAQDLWLFVKELDGGDSMTEGEVDSLMEEIDGKQMGFLGYEDFVYGFMPK